MGTAAAAFFTAVNLMYAAIFGGPIDGTAWDVKVRQQGFFHWTSQSDTLVFHGGKAVIAGEIAKGYAPALYDASQDASGTAFTVRLETEDHDPVVWSGRVKDDRIAGVVVVRRRDGRIARYVFSGGRKAG
jgi:hypothetical protein